MRIRSVEVTGGPSKWLMGLYLLESPCRQGMNLSAQRQRGLIADVRFAGKRLAGYGVIPVDIVRTAPRIASRVY